MRSQYAIRWGVKIPLRDGIYLSANVYLPKRQGGPAPCVFALTPYTADRLHERAAFFASNGLTFVAVDVRGRGNSSGIFRPLHQEAKDGYDITEWLARQDYCDGQVAMWGGSYLGYSQWATAKERPPHLTTIVPAAAPFLGVDFPMRNNIFRPSLMRWITVTSGRASQLQLFCDAQFWSSAYLEWHQSGRPLRELDSQIGNPSALFQEWLSHPEPDAYWDAGNPTAEQYAEIDLPVLTITGSYDDDQPGALEHYRRHASERHYLVIGPWDHTGCTGMPTAQFGGLSFAPQSVIDLPQLQLEWYEWIMRKGPRPAFLRNSVAWYVMGAECWRYSDSLDSITARHETVYLDRALPDTYTYDPRDGSAPELEAEALAGAGSLVDRTVTDALAGRQFVFDMEPFTADVEVSGFFRLSAWISVDCPDTDFFVSVHVVGPDGLYIRLSTDAMRARYRNGLRRPELINTTDPLLYIFERFTFVSRLVKRGQRLRLVIAPLGRIIETNFVQKNYNGGGVVAEESAQVGRVVTVRVYHDETHPCTLYVPIGASSHEAAG